MTVRIHAEGPITVRTYDDRNPSRLNKAKTTSVLVPTRANGQAWMRNVSGEMDARDWAEIKLVADLLGVSTLMTLPTDAQMTPCGVIGRDGITRVDVGTLTEFLTSEFQEPTDFQG